jgi:hypothetical protein
VDRLTEQERDARPFRAKRCIAARGKLFNQTGCIRGDCTAQRHVIPQTNCCVQNAIEIGPGPL